MKGFPFGYGYGGSYRTVDSTDIVDIKPYKQWSTTEYACLIMRNGDQHCTWFRVQEAKERLAKFRALDELLQKPLKMSEEPLAEALKMMKEQMPTSLPEWRGFTWFNGDKAYRWSEELQAWAQIVPSLTQCPRCHCWVSHP